MPVYWYVVRILQGSAMSNDLVQVVSCCKSEKAAQEQLEHTKENVDLTGIAHRYMIWGSSGNNIQREVDAAVNPNKKKVVVDDIEVEEYFP